MSLKSFANLNRAPAGLPLVADSVLEEHAARLLLLLYGAGQKGEISGLTKLAKLDFFVRYPSFFRRIKHREESQEENIVDDLREPSMIRYHYGPWDYRYYQVLSALEARDLMTVERRGKAFVFKLSDAGKSVAKDLASAAEFDSLTERIADVAKELGRYSGSHLKKIIYEEFEKEVVARGLGEVIPNE